MSGDGVTGGGGGGFGGWGWGAERWLAGRGRMEAAALMQFLLPAAIVVALPVQLFFYCQLAFNLKFNV